MNILIVYHSRLGSVKKMARLIARGVESVEGMNSTIRRVAEFNEQEVASDSISTIDDAIATQQDLANCNGLILGSPTRFGNMSAQMKQFLDNSSSIWMQGLLVNKPAAVFTSSSSMHGGQESTLLSMLNPLLHHGMIICGLPYTEKALHHTQTGGTPYGASHVAGSNNKQAISDDEKQLCLALGKRVATLAKQLT